MRIAYCDKCICAEKSGFGFALLGGDGIFLVGTVGHDVSGVVDSEGVPVVVAAGAVAEGVVDVEDEIDNATTETLANNVPLEVAMICSEKSTSSTSYTCSRDGVLERVDFDLVSWRYITIAADCYRCSY